MGLVGMRKPYYDHIRTSSIQISLDFPNLSKKEVLAEARRRRFISNTVHCTWSLFTTRMF